MIDIKFIPTKKNLTNPIYTENYSFIFKYTEELINNKNALYYEAFLIDSNAVICTGDWCLISEPYEGREYVERCDKVTCEDDRGVFYGQEGTRCLACDVVKIIGTTNKSIIEKEITMLNSEIIIKFMDQRPEDWF